MGERDGVLMVRVSAPPLEGKANAAVCELVARRAGVAPSRVSVVRGRRARDKQLLVEGLSDPELRRALGLS